MPSSTRAAEAATGASAGVECHAVDAPVGHPNANAIGGALKVVIVPAARHLAGAHARLLAAMRMAGAALEKRIAARVDPVADGDGAGMTGGRPL